MNERIRELADEAAKFSAIMALPTGESGDNLFVEKFAELIVAECMNVIYNIDDLGGYHFKAANAVKEHFGVEE